MAIARVWKVPHTAKPLDTRAHVIVAVPGLVTVGLEANGAAAASEDELLEVAHVGNLG